MEIEILGAHQSESLHTRSISILINSELAIDAGSLTASLSMAAQERVRAILLTHQHYDHIKDIATIGFNTAFAKNIRVYSLPVVKELLLSHILNEKIWINLGEFPSSERPSLTFHTVEPLVPFQTDGYTILAVPMRHSVPTVGYQVTGPDGKKIFYTSDTGPGWAAGAHLLTPDLIIAEVTFSNRERALADQVGHLAPASLEQELKILYARRKRWPILVAVHMNPKYEEEIEFELKEWATRQKIEIIVAREGLKLKL